MRKDEMKQLRRYIYRHYNTSIYVKDFKYIKLGGNLSRIFCKLRPLHHFKYNSIYHGIKSYNPIHIEFVVRENTLNGLNRLSGPYVGRYLLPNIYAEVTTPNTKSNCKANSFIDSKYSIECPLLEPTFNISIYGSFLPPSIYSYKCTHNDTWLLKMYNNMDLNKLSFKYERKFPSVLNLPKCSPMNIPADLSFWLKRNGTWHWSTSNCFYSFRFDNHSRKCLREKHILMVGDSLMRNRHRAMQKYNLAKSRFIFTTVPSDMASALKRNTRNMSDPSQQIIVLNSGHWPFRYFDPSYYISDMMAVFDVIKDIKRMNPTPKIIWVEISAMPYFSHFRWRVNHFIAAMNDWINFHMKRLGVHICPAFQISHPMWSETTDTTHYEELLENDPDHFKDKVSVGGAIISVLVHMICK